MGGHLTNQRHAAADRLYAEACAVHAPALARLARAVERDADRARDLEQDIHLALWRSLARYDGRCALGTWTYRVAHNVAAGHATRGARSTRLVALEEADALAADDDPEAQAGEAWVIERLHRLIAALKPADRSVILLYLEGLDTATIADVTGLSSSNVGVKVHRIKAMLARQFNSGDPV
ncbi:sigma-70 family RNA polymerase sigma factor [Sphingomonas sp.]|uniref:RNA polymerase sigma factor n=1 Tax=Sphingomonas sp. TaxID=28214 RepID=UPI001ECF66A5|nr:sigma-70 family RNA polymerase sigma factor [Sphingomonas sp.]MBX3595656.1 sigma-70 family RNA polymerase sigma factor [Sphingomonas sp.]